MSHWSVIKNDYYSLLRTLWLEIFSNKQPTQMKKNIYVFFFFEVAVKLNKSWNVLK